MVRSSIPYLLSNKMVVISLIDFGNSILLRYEIDTVYSLLNYCGLSTPSHQIVGEKIAQFNPHHIPYSLPCIALKVTGQIKMFHSSVAINSAHLCRISIRVQN